MATKIDRINGMGWDKIRETYPIGTLLNVEVHKRSELGITDMTERTVIVTGYSSAMFSGSDTDMALAAKDYITGEKLFVETSMVLAVIGK